jgi:hypothetical protein
MCVVRLAGAICVLAGIAGSGVQAQVLARQPDSVPTELALALASSGGLGSPADPQILVAQLPAQFTSVVQVPRSAKVIGSAYSAATTLAVISMPTQPDSALDHFGRALREQGWKEPQMMGYASGGGFRPALTDRNPMLNMRPMLCRDGAFLSYWVGREQAMTTTIIARLQSSPGMTPGGPCATRIQFVGSTASAPAAYRSPFPTLYNPPGSGVGDPYQNSRCGPQGSTGTQTELRSAMTAEEILDHYGRQLQDSGWTRGAGSPQIIGRVWTRKDSLGTPRVLALTVMTSPLDARCRTVKMDADRSRPDY